MGITPALRALVEQATNAVRQMMNAAQLPAPVNDSRCRHCSFNEICQPKVVAERSRYHGLLQNLGDTP